MSQFTLILAWFLAMTAFAQDRTVALDSVQPREGEHAGQHWTNGSGIEFCWCPPGTFLMGSPDSKRADFSDAKQVEVTLSKGFWIGKYEVTQEQVEQLRATSGKYSFFGKQLPVHNVQLGQTEKFLKALNEAERKAGRLSDAWEYALPTEAQWEYACRAGSSTRFYFGDDASQLHRFANYADKRLLADDGAMQFADAQFDDGVGKTLAAVGSYSPNAWGLHDMHGNVAEWCVDRYQPQLPGGVDPRGDDKKSDSAVVRGGSWCSTAAYCESAFRNSQGAGGNAKGRDFIGYRIVLRKK